MRVLDIGLLQAGASMKGEFENRLRQVIDEVQSSPKPIILFIDEAHTLIGAGGAQGTGDAANLLKPALARGKLRTIAATTWAEYKKHIENDPALTRRFQVVKVEEPSEEKAIADAARHRQRAREAPPRAAAGRSARGRRASCRKRYIPDRQLPDKAVSLLDTACARVAVSQHAVPPEVEDCRRRIELFKQELEIIARERRSASKSATRLAEVEQELAEEAQAPASARSTLAIRESAGRSHLGHPRRATPAAATRRRKTRPESLPPAAIADRLRQARSSCSASSRAWAPSSASCKRENPLIFPTRRRAVHRQRSSPIGPASRRGAWSKTKSRPCSACTTCSSERVIGQRSCARDDRAAHSDGARGPGESHQAHRRVLARGTIAASAKPETALTLAEALYGGEQNVITINMSEFQEAHTVSTLKGAPPGYVGYGEGGVLTEAVRRQPYSVVLLDEVEKAHPDVHEIFFQVFDKGWMEDGAGHARSTSRTPSSC